MNKNDEIELNITGLGTDGEGIGKLDGMTFFVNGAVPGDKIKAGVTKLKKTYGYARVIEILKPSVNRVEPPCPVAKQCGGCQIQELNYQAQLGMKEQLVHDDLVRIGGFEEGLIDQIMEPIVGMAEPYHFRNKASYPVRMDRDGNVRIGFYAQHSHRIIETKECLIGQPVNELVIEAVRTWMLENQIAAYNEETGKGLVRHILIRAGKASGEVMVCLVINGDRLPKQEDLLEKILEIHSNADDLPRFHITSISLNKNTKRDNVILGDRTTTIWGNEAIRDNIGDITYEIGPMSFYQVNPTQTEKLYGLALEYADLSGQENVWDLYCGIGTISLFLAQKAKQVFGVEIIPQAIENAKKNAEINHINNAEFFVGKAEEVLPDFYEHAAADREEMLHPDVIVVDPPRKGCDQACLDTMIKMHPEKIVYVSCDPATLARDLKYLCSQGYELKRVRTVDQFCHSMHVETVVLMSKKISK